MESQTANPTLAESDDNAINDEEGKRLDDSLLTRAAIFAFIPPLGAMGIHDFFLKQNKKGVAHILLLILSMIPLEFVNMFCGNNLNCSIIVDIVTWLIQILLMAASYFWAIIEGAGILNQKNHSSAYSASSDANSPNSQSIPSAQLILNDSQKQKQDRKVWSILSITATIIPIILWTYCWKVSGGSTSENGPGAVWWYMIFYYWTLGIPLAVISVAFGIVGLKTKYRWVSIISLLLKVVSIAAVALLIFIN